MFAIDKKVLDAVLGYLGGRPYVEVARLIQMIGTIKPIEEPPAPKIIDATDQFKKSE